MANEFARNIQDKLLTVTRALTASDGSVTSSDIDLGADPASFENAELEISIPELSGTELASADTLVIVVQGGASATPSTSLGLTKTITGDGNTIAAQSFRFRLPSNCGRYVNVKFTSAGTSGDMSDKTATIKLLL